MISREPTIERLATAKALLLTPFGLDETHLAVALPLGLWIAAALWTAGFGVFVWRFAPVLTLPNPARRQPNGR